MVLDKGLFTDDTVRTAQRLLGCTLHFRGCGGIISETEAYQAEGDPACVRFYSKKVQAFARDAEGGELHIHKTYGMHYMLNILVKKDCSVGFVLIRALIPNRGLSRMRKRRDLNTDRHLSDGPGKLTQALGLDARVHGKHLLSVADLSLPETSPKFLATPRIGISKGKDLPWRFVLA